MVWSAALLVEAVDSGDLDFLGSSLAAPGWRELWAEGNEGHCCPGNR